MSKLVDVEKAAKAVCRYCKMGMPREGDTHIRGFMQFMEVGTDTHYPCKASGVWRLRPKKETMRKGIDYIGVGVGAAIFDGEGRLFITKRGPKAKNERGKWEVPGGGVDFGETFEQAIKREMKEENDIEIEVIELLGIYDHIIPDEGQHWVSPTYICRIVAGEPKILEPDKCAEIGWFTIEEAEQLPLSIITRHDIEVLKQKYPKGYRKE
jgi:8-oxo-dGTP diphosphatase